jgi:transcriptional regulator with XRE-family HTH domain
MDGTSSALERRIGAFIRQLRHEHSFTLLQLARRARVDLSHLARIERGESGTTFANYQRIARSLGLELPGLFSVAVLPPRRKATRRKTQERERKAG